MARQKTLGILTDKRRMRLLVEVVSGFGCFFVFCLVANVAGFNYNFCTLADSANGRLRLRLERVRPFLFAFLVPSNCQGDTAPIKLLASVSS
jgi:hypothetical protein